MERNRRTFVAAMVMVSQLIVPAMAQTDGKQLTLSDIDGRVVAPFHGADSAKASVFLFARTDCPIANRFAPALEQLRQRFEPRGVRFWLVFVDPREPAAVVRQHVASYGPH